MSRKYSMLLCRSSCPVPWGSSVTTPPRPATLCTDPSRPIPLYTVSHSYAPSSTVPPLLLVPHRTAIHRHSLLCTAPSSQVPHRYQPHCNLPSRTATPRPVPLCIIQTSPDQICNAPCPVPYCYALPHSALHTTTMHCHVSQVPHRYAPPPPVPHSYAQACPTLICHANLCSAPQRNILLYAAKLRIASHCYALFRSAPHHNARHRTTPHYYAQPSPTPHHTAPHCYA